MLEVRLIAFVGQVGVGKSTQINLLVYYLKSRGVKVKVTFLKTGHFITYLLGMIFGRILEGNPEIYPLALLERRPYFFKKIFKFWLVLDIIGVNLKFLFNIYIPIKLGYTVLVEEYLPAIILDYMYMCKIISLPFKSISFIINFILLNRISLNTDIIFLDADVNTLKSRWTLRGTQHRTPYYLYFQRNGLLHLSRYFFPYRLHYFNTINQTVKKTQNEIIECLHFRYLQ